MNNEVIAFFISIAICILIQAVGIVISYATKNLLYSAVAFILMVLAMVGVAIHALKDK